MNRIGARKATPSGGASRRMGRVSCQNVANRATCASTVISNSNDAKSPPLSTSLAQSPSSNCTQATSHSAPLASSLDF